MGVAQAQTFPTASLRAGTTPGGAPQTAAHAPGAHADVPQNLPHGTTDNPYVYTIGSGDVLSISVWKERELSPMVTVRPDGRISIPLVGEITVTGLTPLQAEDLLRSKLASLVVNPQVTVSVSEIHSRMVYITGEVSRPGAYPLNTPMDILQLIAEAGGLTEFASRHKIRVLRAGDQGKAIPFDYASALRSNALSHTIPLLPGDTVVVP